MIVWWYLKICGSWKFQFPLSPSSSNLDLKGFLDIYLKGAKAAYIIYKSIAFALPHQYYIWYLIQLTWKSIVLKDF